MKLTLRRWQGRPKRPRAQSKMLLFTRSKDLLSATKSPDRQYKLQKELPQCSGGGIPSLNGRFTIGQTKSQLRRPGRKPAPNVVLTHRCPKAIDDGENREWMLITRNGASISSGDRSNEPAQWRCNRSHRLRCRSQVSARFTATVKKDLENAADWQECFGAQAH